MYYYSGKDALIVIAHDFKWKEDQLPKIRMDQEETIRARQPTVYQFAGNVILAGKLGKQKSPNVLRDCDWDVILAVIYEKGKTEMINT